MGDSVENNQGGEQQPSDAVVDSASTEQVNAASTQQDVQTSATQSSTEKSVIELVDGEDEQVASLKLQLAAFMKALIRPGEKPEDFKQAAKLVAQITKHVIQYPKVPVLDTFLAFFKQNIEGACDSNQYMKGVTTLNQDEQLQVGYLYGLFADLARGQVVKINSGKVIHYLKKAEIVNYYNRKVAVLTQVAAQ